MERETVNRAERTRFAQIIYRNNCQLYYQLPSCYLAPPRHRAAAEPSPGQTLYTDGTGVRCVGGTSPSPSVLGPRPPAASRPPPFPRSQVLQEGVLAQIDAVRDVLAQHEGRHQVVHIARLARVGAE